MRVLIFTTAQGCNTHSLQVVMQCQRTVSFLTCTLLIWFLSRHLPSWSLPSSLSVYHGTVEPCQLHHVISPHWIGFAWGPSIRPNVKHSPQIPYSNSEGFRWGRGIQNQWCSYVLSTILTYVRACTVPQDSNWSQRCMHIHLCCSPPILLLHVAAGEPIDTIFWVQT